MGSARAEDSAACAERARKFEAEKAELAAPQVSAALFGAADDGCEALVRRLLDYGASVEARDRIGGSALHHAARNGQAQIVRLLVQKGALVNLRNTAGSTPLYVAIERNQAAAAEALVELGADVSVPGRSQVSPLAAAAFNGNAVIVDMLLRHGADPNARDSTGKVPIVYAAARASTPAVDRLLATGIDVNARYANDLTLLMWAAGHASDVPAESGVKLVGALLDKGAAVDATDDRGRTPLMTAAEIGHAEIVDLLLRRGAKPDLKDRDGKIAADLAMSQEIRDRLGRP